MLAVLLLFAAPEADLVPGRFGKALNAARTPLAFGGDVRYRTPPLTVECWANLNSKRGFQVLVSSDEKPSAEHWELYAYNGSGRLSAYLPGYEPSEIVSKSPICDGQWHHVAMTFDGKEVALYLDGRRVHTQTVKKRAGLKPNPGPLFIGMAVEGSNRIGCDGLIDDVRISRIVRKIAVPAGPLVADADAVGVWPFDEGTKILADPAWTPPPASLGEKWERMSDPDWVDARLRKMDTGPTFNAGMNYPHNTGRVTVYKSTAIKTGSGGVMFDRSTLRLAAAWTDGWLQHSDRRFGLLNTPTPLGKMIYSTPAVAGWADKEGKFPAVSGTAPIEWGRFHGLYLHGGQVVLAYAVHGVEVWEAARIEGATLIRDFEVGPSDKPLTLSAFGLRLVDPERACTEAGTAEAKTVRINPSPKIRRFSMRQGDAPTTTPDLRAATKPATARWKEIVTKGEMGKNTGSPYVVDTLTIPYDNPYNALFFCTGLDFLPDGRIAMCTAHGDVWLVRTDEKLEKIVWQRYATGLYQPLGLKVIDGKVIILERGQLTRLHGKEEAHHYENICNLWHTGSGEHSYDTCLESDAEGNFYFFKTGDTHLEHGGCLLRVSRDGKKVETYATGFRHPIGLGVGPDGRVTGADQEGNWMPVTRVDIYRQGGFYGDMRAHHRATPPKTYDLPLIWLPKDVDNSAGGQAWVPHDRFGLPVGQMLHFSYGRCKLYAMHRQQVDGVDQGAAVDLGVTFLSGSARGRFHPTDGALYVCGLNGWQTAAKRDGCLQRVRYTGQELPFVLSHEVFTDGVHVRFARKIDTSAIASGWMVEQWDYRWSADYGSKRWSVRTPGREGMDRLEVSGVKVDEDGKGVYLSIKDMRPAMQMRIGHAATKTVIHSTVHRMAKR